MALKLELRKSYLQQRNDMREYDVIHKSKSIGQKLFELDYYKKSKAIFTYVNMGNEVQTKDIIYQAFVDQKIVAVPKIIKASRKMIFVKINSLEELSLGHFNVLEPLESDEIISDDDTLFLVPGAVFDSNGYRIGYGGGYYDKYLSTCKALCTTGLAYDFQLVERIAAQEYDQAVNLVITENRLLVCTKPLGY